ncbi:MAG: maleylpyruvate isomerase family mycothiol-dependent enzyme [Marmoricola sp.]
MMYTATSGPPSDETLESINAAASRLLATTSTLHGPDWLADTVLPDWTRAHVAAHLVLNSEAMVAVLDGMHSGVPTPMYLSDASRDTAIDVLAAEDPAAITKRLQAGGVAFADAVRRVPTEAWSGSFGRLPDGPPMPAGAVIGMRRREIEIHHADLGAGYGPGDWPGPFVAELLDTMAADHASSGPFLVTATDLGRTWQVGGSVGPEVSGTGADLAWWLLGRAQSSDLRCDWGPRCVSEELPAIGPWRRSPHQK